MLNLRNLIDKGHPVMEREQLAPLFTSSSFPLQRQLMDSQAQPHSQSTGHITSHCKVGSKPMWFPGDLAPCPSVTILVEN